MGKLLSTALINLPDLGALATTVIGSESIKRLKEKAPVAPSPIVPTFTVRQPHGLRQSVVDAATQAATSILPKQTLSSDYEAAKASTKARVDAAVKLGTNLAAKSEEVYDKTQEKADEIRNTNMNLAAGAANKAADNLFQHKNMVLKARAENIRNITANVASYLHGLNKQIESAVQYNTRLQERNIDNIEKLLSNELANVDNQLLFETDEDKRKTLIKRRNELTNSWKSLQEVRMGNTYGSIVNTSIFGNQAIQLKDILSKINLNYTQ